MKDNGLTDLRLRNESPPAAGQKEIWDKTVRGFGVRIGAGGTRSFILVYRFEGRARRLTLGRYPDLSLKEARLKAQEALAQVAQGKDPGAAKRESARRPLDLESFTNLVSAYIEEHAKAKTRRWKETERLLQREFVPRWRQKRATEITVEDVRIALSDINARSHSLAFNGFRVLRSCFAWAIANGYLNASPVERVPRPSSPQSRERTLSDQELAAIWRALDKLGYPFGDITRLLILAGLRREEVTSARWADINLEKAEWYLSPSHTKNKRAHIVPLSPSAVDVIRSVPRLESPLLFPAQRESSSRPVSGFSKAKVRLDQLSGVTDWRFHDLRRTLATRLAQWRVPQVVVEKILNHVSGSLSGVAGIYNRYDYLDERRDALDQWAKHVVSLDTYR